jgi:ABC-type multidrug transport system fused ATPase/permease subunit
VIFSDNARENIRHGWLNASHEEVVSAAKWAQLEEFIRRLP